MAALEDDFYHGPRWRCPKVIWRGQSKRFLFPSCPVYRGEIGVSAPAVSLHGEHLLNQSDPSVGRYFDGVWLRFLLVWGLELVHKFG